MESTLPDNISFSTREVDVGLVMRRRRIDNRRGQIMVRGVELEAGDLFTQPNHPSAIYYEEDVMCNGWRVVDCCADRGMTNAWVKCCPRPQPMLDRLVYILFGWPEMALPVEARSICVYGNVDEIGRLPRPGGPSA